MKQRIRTVAADIERAHHPIQDLETESVVLRARLWPLCGTASKRALQAVVDYEDIQVLVENETQLLEMEDAEGGFVATKNHAGILHAAHAMYQEGKASWRRFVNHFAEEHRRAAQKEFKAEVNNYLYLAIAAERLGADDEAGNKALRVFLSPEIMRRVPMAKFRSAMTFINLVLGEAEAAGIQSRICTSKAVLFSCVLNDEAAEKEAREALRLSEQEEDESKALALHAWAWTNREDSQTALSYIELALKFQKREIFACGGIVYAWKNAGKALAERWSAVDLEDYAELGPCNPIRAPALRFQRRMKKAVNGLSLSERFALLFWRTSSWSD